MLVTLLKKSKNDVSGASGNGREGNANEKLSIVSIIYKEIVSSSPIATSDQKVETRYLRRSGGCMYGPFSLKEKDCEPRHINEWHIKKQL